MNDLIAQHSGSEIHVILDNLNTHKPKQDRWLARHPNVHFHFIPTYSSPETVLGGRVESSAFGCRIWV
jgi:hypothetical protein